MKTKLFLGSLIIAAMTLNGCSAKLEKKEESAHPKGEKAENINPKPERTINGSIAEFIRVTKARKYPVSLNNAMRIDTVITDSINKEISVVFNKELLSLPFRENNVKEFYSELRNYLGTDYNEFNLSVYSGKQKIEYLIPNYYRNNPGEYDKSRLSSPLTRPLPIIKNLSRRINPEKGLLNRNIVLWQSHGWYYSNDEKRWEWQRPRLFQSVEDKIPLSFVIPYITPMLENAGATVFLPRERDIQTNEVIVDNDTPSKSKSNNTSEQGRYTEFVTNKKIKWQNSTNPGFALGTPPYPEKYNPFTKGTVRRISADSVVSAEVQWIPAIPEEGFYAVYISYERSESNVTDAHYTVYHAGGKTEFSVNQTIGGSTWIYLGTFKFSGGLNPSSGKVVMDNRTAGESKGKFITADAVRFGGGMGIVMREGKTSGRPKYLEGSRYWLQFAGMPDTLVWDLNLGRNDYNDDYQSRGEYANYLYGAPFGPNRNRNEKGLGIPIDLSMAFHTDAGITHNDTSIGTLAIYSSEDIDERGVFPDNVSRLASRDLTDLIQTQIVEDIRTKYDPAWSRRQMKDAQYSEAYRPNTPSVLLELLSHQNFLDMKFFHDPRFRFDVARAIYKGMLRFISTQNGTDYIVQPLPVDHFQAILKGNGKVHLKWQPVVDSLETSAIPEYYIVYTRTGNGDFDNGQIVNEPCLEMQNLKDGVIYSFKITAANKGGESFPSEILSVCNLIGKSPVLIINGFDRVSGPAQIETKEYTGFDSFTDAGVPDKYDISFTGRQHDYSPESPFVTNDAPGHGASNADHETDIIAGNTFDFTIIHGKSIKSAGFSFCSASDESVQEGKINLNDFRMVDYILGEEKETSWPKAFGDLRHGKQFQTFPQTIRNVFANYCKSGGNLFISGSYVATDLLKGKGKDSPEAEFAGKVLKFGWGTDHASRTGKVIPSRNYDMFKKEINFNTILNKYIYAVEAPDAVIPADGSSVLLRYEENGFPAAVGFKKDYGTFILGFPFETISAENERDAFMKEITGFFRMK